MLRRSEHPRSPEPGQQHTQGSCPDGPGVALRLPSVLLLAFDTATPRISVALHDGARVLAEASAEDARRHGELLAPFITRVLSEAGRPAGEVTGIVTGVGPGPYTGLRVGVVTARVLGEALQVPVYGVCTLDVIAY